MTRSLTEIRQAIAWQLKESIGEDRFDLWFSEDHSLSIENGQLIVSAGDELSLKFIQQQFHQPLRESMEAVLGNRVSLRFIVHEEKTIVHAEKTDCVKQHALFSADQLVEAGMQPTPTGELREKPKPNRRRNTRRHDAAHEMPLLTGRTPQESQSLDAFQFGKKNLLLETAIQELFAEPGKFNPLVLHGPVGCGKSHLVTAIVARARQTRQFRRCVNITAEQFTSSFIDALQNRRLTDFRSKFRNLDLLAMDDIQFLSGKQATIIEFQNTLETLMRTGKQIVITSDRPVAELRFAEDTLFTRLSAGLTCPIRYPDLEGRIEIVRHLATTRKVRLSADVERIVAERIGRDVRLLSGAVNRLKAMTMVCDDTLDMAAAEQCLADLFHTQSPIVSLAKIERVVCDICGVDSDELKSSKRIKRISTARMLAMWLSRKYTSAGLAEIGKFYGGRSHSTVVAAEKKINGLLQADEAIQLRTHQTSISSAMGRLKHSLDVG
ncbi:MAG: DnaA/Hda family protein [Pirellulaceae bacterium]|nr:ATP-binding protein [Planctomycetaceae bacterium]MDG2103130.1 DnaA/Hda family protein [Pirellulaceae bacterium]